MKIAAVSSSRTKPFASLNRSCVSPGGGSAKAARSLAIAACKASSRSCQRSTVGVRAVRLAISSDQARPPRAHPADLLGSGGGAEARADPCTIRACREWRRKRVPVGEAAGVDHQRVGKGVPLRNANSDAAPARPGGERSQPERQFKGLTRRSRSISARSATNSFNIIDADRAWRHVWLIRAL